MVFHHLSLAYCILLVKDQSGFYQIRGLGICINIKAFNWVYRLLRLLLLINQLLIKKAKKGPFLGVEFKSPKATEPLQGANSPYHLVHRYQFLLLIQSSSEV